MTSWLSWRLEMPAVTEDRCRACSLQGGMVVETEKEADTYSRMTSRAVRVGEELQEPPCCPPWKLAELQRREGRPCPRVELSPENLVVSELCALSLPEHTRHLVGPMLQATTPRRKRAGILRRLARALQSRAVADRLAPRVPRG